MDREGIDLMGPSEVIKRIRGENPYALNSFFMIGKIETLEKVMREYQINLKFSSLNLECDIDEYKKEYEPYYDFFWNYYKKGYKISFLSTDFDEEYRCTSLLDNKGTPFGFHMWYTRDWYSKKMTPLGLSNFDRYSKMRRFLKMNFDIRKLDFIRLNIWADYMIISFSRIFIKNIYRVRRRLVNK